MRKFFQFIGFIVVLGFVLGLILMGSGMWAIFHKDKADLHDKSVLVLNLDGIIIDGQQFLEDLREYREEDDVKGILIRIDSPGGVVGPSQEIYQEIQNTRDQFKKPVVVYSAGLLASGAYYAAVGADKIVVSPGTLMGSIGVIMEFVNLQGLYKWAKVDRYVIKTGKFKDTGADYRPMSDEERNYMSGVMNEVWEQFKGAIAQGRKLSPEVVNSHADGRVFTGETGVRLGFADQVGTYTDAVKLIGQMTGLGDKPDLFEAPEKRPRFIDMFLENEFSEESVFRKLFRSEGQRLKLSGQLLYMMPGTSLE